MKSQTLINLLGVILLLALIVAVGATLWHFAHVPVFLATVSWNG